MFTCESFVTNTIIALNLTSRLICEGKQMHVELRRCKIAKSEATLREGINSPKRKTRVEFMPRRETRMHARSYPFLGYLVLVYTSYSKSRCITPSSDQPINRCRSVFHASKMGIVARAIFLPFLSKSDNLQIDKSVNRLTLFCLNTFQFRKSKMHGS